MAVGVGDSFCGNSIVEGTPDVISEPGMDSPGLSGEVLSVGQHAYRAPVVSSAQNYSGVPALDRAIVYEDDPTENSPSADNKTIDKQSLSRDTKVKSTNSENMPEDLEGWRWILVAVGGSILGGALYFAHKRR